MNLTFLTLFIIIWGLLVTVLGFITLNRYIAYKERVAMAQLGLPLEMYQVDVSRRTGKRGVLWGGVITAMSGLALLLGLSTLGTGVWVLGGLVPLFIGIGLVAIYFLLGNAPEQPKKASEHNEDTDSPPKVDASLSSDESDHPS